MVNMTFNILTTNITICGLSSFSVLNLWLKGERVSNNLDFGCEISKVLV